MVKPAADASQGRANGGRPSHPAAGQDVYAGPRLSTRVRSRHAEQVNVVSDGQNRPEPETNTTIGTAGKGVAGHRTSWLNPS